MVRNACDLASLCVVVGSATINVSAVFSVIASISATVWFASQYLRVRRLDREAAARDAAEMEGVLTATDGGDVPA